MASGYTYPVRDGEVTSLTEFALSCARAMGAAIHQRDDGAGPIAEVPDSSSEYAARRLAFARDHLAEALARTPNEWAALQEQRRAQVEEAYAAAALERAQHRERYEAMLLQVMAWTPPSAAHEGLKTFMIEQLQDSIRFDCDITESSVPPLIEPEVYAAREIDAARRTLALAEEYWDQEQERVATQRAWVRDLRASLPSEHDHDEQCCSEHGTHTMPHRGCILR